MTDVEEFSAHLKDSKGVCANPWGHNLIIVLNKNFFRPEGQPKEFSFHPRHHHPIHDSLFSSRRSLTRPITRLYKNHIDSITSINPF